MAETHASPTESSDNQPKGEAKWRETILQYVSDSLLPDLWPLLSDLWPLTSGLCSLASAPWITQASLCDRP
jgi:hypothetical protein